MPQKDINKNYVSIQRFDKFTYLVLFFLFVGCIMPGPYAIGNYNNGGGDLHYLYIAKIGFWLFPIGIWAFINFCVRGFYSFFINYTYFLKTRTDRLTIQHLITDEEQKLLGFAIKRCLAIKRIAPLFLLFPNRHHPFNKEIELYFPSDQKQNFSFKKTIKKILKFFLILMIPVYVGLGIYYQIHTFHDWNYQISYPGIAKTSLNIYTTYIKESLQTQRTKDKISTTDFTKWDTYFFFKNKAKFGKDNFLSDKYGFQSDNLDGWFKGNVESTTNAHDKVYFSFYEDVWNKNKTFDLLFYIKTINPVNGSLTFYLRFRIYNKEEFNKFAYNDATKISIYYTAYSQLFYVDNFIKVPNKKSYKNPTPIEYNS